MIPWLPGPYTRVLNDLQGPNYALDKLEWVLRSSLLCSKFCSLFFLAFPQFSAYYAHFYTFQVCIMLVIFIIVHYYIKMIMIGINMSYKSNCNIKLHKNVSKLMTVHHMDVDYMISLCMQVALYCIVSNQSYGLHITPHHATSYYN